MAITGCGGSSSDIASTAGSAGSAGSSASSSGGSSSPGATGNGTGSSADAGAGAGPGQSGSGGSFAASGGATGTAGPPGTGGSGTGGIQNPTGTGGIGGAAGTSANGGAHPGTGGAPVGTGAAPVGAGGAPVVGAGGAASGAGGLSSGSGGTSAGGASGQCPANAIFCADFESGGIPAQALFFPEYLRPTVSTYLTIDATTGFNSGHSAKFAGTSFSQMLGVPTGTSTFWTRVYLRSDADMSMIPGHATYVAATDGNGDPNMGEHVRIGEHECQLELNRKSDDKELLSNGGTYQCSGGVVFAKDAWACLETFFNGPGREVRVFVAGVETASLHVTDWGPFSYDMFKFGFENYSSPARNMWYDDIAVAPQRIGCH